MKITPEERYGFEESFANMISNTKYASTYLFYAHMISQCSVVFDKTLPAAAGVAFKLDHFNLYINPTGIEGQEEYTAFNSFPLEERLGILKHEMLHILNGHVARKEDRDHQRWNYATDCAINQLIEKDHLPDWTVSVENFPAKSTVAVTENCTSEQYYEMIDDQKMPPQNGSCSSGQGDGSGDGQGNSQNPGQGKPLDDHSKWQESQGDPELQDDVTKNMMDKAVSATQKSRGDIPSQFSGWLDMFTHKRELDWRQVLRGIVGNKRVGSRKTIIRQDRRLPNFEWIKGRTKDRMFDLLVVSDVSGSVSDDALLSLWGEVRYICDVTQSAVSLIQVDTRPSAPEKLAKNTKIIERKACGGTILHPALEMAKKHRIEYNALVVTTDGWLDSHDVLEFKKLNKRVIWLVEKDGQIMDEMNTGLMKAFKLKD